MMQAVCLGDSVPFFADVTVRHSENDNAELLWHCGNFPLPLMNKANAPTIGCSKYHGNTFGICEWELKQGDLTIARFDGDHGKYQLLIGEAKTTTGPKNVGSSFGWRLTIGQSGSISWLRVRTSITFAVFTVNTVRFC